MKSSCETGLPGVHLNKLSTAFLVDFSLNQKMETLLDFLQVLSGQWIAVDKNCIAVFRNMTKGWGIKKHNEFYANWKDAVRRVSTENMIENILESLLKSHATNFCDILKQILSVTLFLAERGLAFRVPVNISVTLTMEISSD